MWVKVSLTDIRYAFIVRVWICPCLMWRVEVSLARAFRCLHNHATETRNNRMRVTLLYKSCALVFSNARVLNNSAILSNYTLLLFHTVRAQSCLLGLPTLLSTPLLRKRRWLKMSSKPLEGRLAILTGASGSKQLSRGFYVTSGVPNTQQLLGRLLLRTSLRRAATLFSATSFLDRPLLLRTSL